MGLGANLVVIARKRAGLTQRALALRLGVPASTVARWESGQHAPSIDALQTTARACGLDLTVGLANADDSYDRDIALRLALTPTERVRALVSAPAVPFAIAAALHQADVRYVLIGELAGAAHGWPITLGQDEFLIVPDDAPRNIARLQQAAEALGGGAHEIDDPYAALDVTWSFLLPDRGWLRAAVTLAGTGGYRDLRRTARSIALQDSVVQLASLPDLIRIADASPRAERRTYLPALWATLERSETAAPPRRRAA